MPACREKRSNVALRAALDLETKETRCVWVCQRELIYARLTALHRKGRDVSGNDVTGIADKPALVSTIKLMDDRTQSTFPTFTPTLFPFVDFRFIGFHPHVKRIIRTAAGQRSMFSHFNLVSMLLLVGEIRDWQIELSMIRYSYLYYLDKILDVIVRSFSKPIRKRQTRYEIR